MPQHINGNPQTEWFDDLYANERAQPARHAGEHTANDNARPVALRTDPTQVRARQALSRKLGAWGKRLQTVWRAAQMSSARTVRQFENSQREFQWSSSDRPC